MITCVLCGQKFNTQINLVKHFMSLHIVEEYQCVYCAHKFDQEALLEDHLDYVHNDTEANHLEQINFGHGGAGISPDYSDAETTEVPSKRKPRTCQRSQADGKTSNWNKGVVVKKEINSDFEDTEYTDQGDKGFYKEESPSEEDEPIVRKRKRGRSKSTAATAAAASTVESDYPEPPVQVKVEPDFDGFDVNELWAADSEEEKKPLKKRSKTGTPKSAARKTADSSQKEFPCDQCDSVLRSKNSLNIHRKRNHCENLLASKEVSVTLDCEICTKKVSIFNVYTHHVRKESNKTGEIIYACDICSKNFHSKRSCTRHIKSSHTSQKLDDVRQQIDDSKSHKCKICKTRFLRRNGLLKHNKQRHSVKPAADPSTAEAPKSCLICEEKILGLCIYSHHIVANEKSEGIFTCNICMQEFNIKQTCSRHIRDDHLAKESQIDEAKEKFRSQFFCNVCQKATSREEKFSHHIIEQKSEEPEKNVTTYLCDLCSTSFTALEECHKHLSVTHYKLSGISKMDTFYCLTCDTMIMESERYSHHMDVITRENDDGRVVSIYTCNVCNKEFNNVKFCKLHMVNHLGVPKRQDKLTFFCKICNETVTSHDKLSHHITVTRIDKNRYNYACNICNKSYDKVRTCRAHLTGYHILEICETCGKEVSAGSLKKHQQAHTQPPPTCTECNEIFKDSAIYRRHMEEKHGVIIKNTRADRPSNQKSHLCDSCGKGFKWKADLAVHVRTHILELCNICNQNVTSLKVHMKKKHAKLVSVKCDVCGILCASDESLAKHKLRNHTGQNTFGCNYCVERFPSAVKRIEHMSDVHGLKHMLDALKCDICGKVVSTKQSKEKHMVTAHGGQKPYPCGQCNKGFFEIRVLNIHMEKVHSKIRNFICMHCGKGLVNASRLKYHINRFHNGVMPPELDERPPRQPRQQQQSRQLLHHEQNIYVKNEGNLSHHELYASQFSD